MHTQQNTVNTQHVLLTLLVKPRGFCLTVRDIWVTLSCRLTGRKPTGRYSGLRSLISDTTWCNVSVGVADFDVKCTPSRAPLKMSGT